MSDLLRTTIVTQFVKEVPPSTQVLVNDSLVLTPITQVSGTKQLAANQTDFIIAESAKYVYLQSDDEFTVTKDDVELFTTKVFMYLGDAATFKVTNPSLTLTMDLNFVYSIV